MFILFWILTFGRIENVVYIPRFIEAMFNQDSEWYTETLIVEFADNFVRLFFDNQEVARWIQLQLGNIIL